MSEVTTIVRQLVSTPTAEWEDSITSLSPEQLAAIAEEAEQVSFLLTLVAGYASARGGDGYSDMGHDRALKAGTFRVEKIKHALGYPNQSAPEVVKGEI